MGLPDAYFATKATHGPQLNKSGHSQCPSRALGHFSRTRQTIKWTHSSSSSIANNVGVDFSRPNIAVVEDFLDRSDITSRS